MKLLLSLVWGIVLSAAAGSGVSQEPPKAILIDEFERIGCEDLSSRLDLLLGEMRNRPDSSGYVVIPSNSENVAWREGFIDGYARWRDFEEDRFIVVRGNFQDPPLTQAWLVPAGAESPAVTANDQGYQLDGSPRKVHIFGDFDDPGTCHYTGPPFRMLSKYLKANPDRRANIAVGLPSSFQFRDTRKEIIKSFREDYGVDPARLRFFWVRTLWDRGIYEFWLIGKKIR